MKTLLVAILVAGLAGSASAHDGDHHDAAGQQAPASHGKILRFLGAGTYTATVKALVCEACGPKVVETLSSVPGIADVSVDQAKSQLTFAVKKGSKINVASLQKKLKAVSDQMGMGADYSLRDIRPTRR